MVRIAGSHPAGPDLIPGAGTQTFYKQATYIRILLAIGVGYNVPQQLCRYLGRLGQ